MEEEDVSALWRRLDKPGHEAVRIYGDDEGWYLDGSAVFLHEDMPCRLEYMIECDADWQTTFVAVDGFVGDDVIAIEIEAADGTWFANGEEVRAVEGCTDIDLNFSPVTNLLPIKRLNMSVGEATTVRAAWLRFPTFELEPLEQTYARKEESVYNYRSSTAFERDITVDKFGLVTQYGEFWTRES